MIKKSADEWLDDPQYNGIVIMDADGWNRHGDFEDSWREKITEAEFKRRLSQCTLMMRK